MKIVAFMCSVLGFASLAVGEQSVTFNGDIRPILSDKCFACHGPSEPDREGDLRLDQPDGEFGALTKREGSFSQFAIKPGDLEESELWYRITTDDDDDRMPPEDSHKDRLTTEEVELIKEWILDGADYQLFWSFVLPVKPPVASVENKAWGGSMIDNRVMARLEQEGLQPRDEADKRTLLRRVTFDLTGLPPTLDEIDVFLRDNQRDAYARVVEDLLQRDSYGEHMTRYWADIVRLADTNGMHHDFDRDFTTYRDWLIRSFNDNLPYDEFITYQLAGDLYDKPTQDQLVASGFNRLHMIIDQGTALPEESLHKNVVDRVEAFGTAFLGLTVQCAQCHDHKYDPISQKEYYQFYAFFNNFSGKPETTRAPERGLQPPFVHLTSPDQQVAIDEFETKIGRITKSRSIIQERLNASEKWPDKLDKVPVPWIWKDSEGKRGKTEFRTTLKLTGKPEFAIARYTGLSTAEVRINGRPFAKARGKDQGVAADLSNVLKRGNNLIEAFSKGEPGFSFVLEYKVDGTEGVLKSGSDWQARASDEDEWQPAVELKKPNRRDPWTEKALPENVARLKRKIDGISAQKKSLLNSIPAAMVMQEKEAVRLTTVLVRGMYDAPGKPVERNTPAFLPPMKSKEGVNTRLDLAEWLVDPSHPLTARVAVNRFWQQLFGIGLVKTPDDFGSQGEWPSHPALLDDLVVSFIESGWDVKELVRSMVLSNTYKQRSDATPEEYERDPENRLLARGVRYRMDAEMIRDQILAVSGQLNRSMYGRSVRPPQPPGLWEMVNMEANRAYVTDTDDNIVRRSLYTFWRRAIPPPQMTIMNAPSREFCVVRRERTNTPLQALLLMNEQEYFSAAKACAKLTLDEGLSTKKGLRRLYETITSHEPGADRLKFITETLLEFKDIYASDRALTEALTPDLGEWNFEERIELASWTMLAHGLLNLELTKVRR